MIDLVAFQGGVQGRGALRLALCASFLRLGWLSSAKWCRPQFAGENLPALTLSRWEGG
jgi:hypothetical protein